MVVIDFIKFKDQHKKKTIALMWIHEVTASCQDDGNHGACHENHTSAVPFAETTDFMKFKLGWWIEWISFILFKLTEWGFQNAAFDFNLCNSSNPWIFGCAQLDMSLWFPFVTWMFLLIVSAAFRSQDHNRKKWVIVFPCCSVIVESGENVAKHTRWKVFY